MKLFLRQLFDSGMVTVPLPGEPFESAEDAAAEMVAFDEAARLDFPGEAPPLDRAVAGWAALRIAEIARLIVARDLGEPEMAAIFALPCPAAPSPETDFSADLFLRYLPGLAKIIDRLSPGDPLLARVTQFAAGWPLSAPGMKLTAPPTHERLDVFARHVGLCQLYADRILAASDVSLVGHPAIDAALRGSLGAQPELCPAIAAALGLAVVDRAGAANPASPVEIFAAAK